VEPEKNPMLVLSALAQLKCSTSEAPVCKREFGPLEVAVPLFR
jgi:hypothetical protein